MLILDWAHYKIWSVYRVRQREAVNSFEASTYCTDTKERAKSDNHPEPNIQYTQKLY